MRIVSIPVSFRSAHSNKLLDIEQFAIEHYNTARPLVNTAGSACSPKQTRKIKKRAKIWHANLNAKLSTETITAINRAVIAGLKGDFARTSAIRANGVEHLAVVGVASTGVVFAGIAAGSATLGLVGKALFCKELLILYSKGKLLATVLACDCLVFEHEIPLLN